MLTSRLIYDSSRGSLMVKQHVCNMPYGGSIPLPGSNKESFYTSKEYRLKQSLITKRNWKKGVFRFQEKKVLKICKRDECFSLFKTQLADPKSYCSGRCAASVNNRGRILSLETREKIRIAVTGKQYLHRRPSSRKPFRPKRICQNPECAKEFTSLYWRPYKPTRPQYCSNQCAMRVIGGKPTSPRASRGKSGIRTGVSSSICFYSRWEANIARLLNLLNIEWEFEPRTFSLTTQTYTPDFYLPHYNLWIEVKNYMSPYSQNRDSQFRELYPEIKLVLLLKSDYLRLQKIFAPYIPGWEFNKTRGNIVRV